MLRKLIALSVVFGLVVASPLTEISTPSPRTDLAVLPDPFSFIFNVITTLIGYKASALSIAVDIIDWLIYHSITIIFGAIATLGFCKLTSKCSILYDAYEEYLPVGELRSLVTPERLESAEKFLAMALDKYAEERGKR